MRKEDHFTDRLRSCKEHDQPIDSDPDPTCRGHAILEGIKELAVDLLLLLASLLLQSLTLKIGVIQF